MKVQALIAVSLATLMGSVTASPAGCTVTLTLPPQTTTLTLPPTTLTLPPTTLTLPPSTITKTTSTTKVISTTVTVTKTKKCRKNNNGFAEDGEE